VVIYDAGKMHGTAANAFLKTLEEPPEDTIIFLTTSRLHAILPTIAGRCSVTRLSSDGKLFGNKEMQIWLANYSAWLSLLFDTNCEKKNSAIMQMYLLLTQLEALLANLLEEPVTDDFSGEQLNKQGIYGLLLAQIENETANFFRNRLEHVKIFPKIISNLEGKAYLIALNVNFMACVETFLIEIFQMVVKFP
jgi:DNA polymerase-3 subunit delta'